MSGLLAAPNSSVSSPSHSPQPPMSRRDIVLCILCRLSATSRLRLASPPASSRIMCAFPQRRCGELFPLRGVWSNYRSEEVDFQHQCAQRTEDDEMAVQPSENRRVLISSSSSIP
nr:hypothetical protein Iba_scaffold41823CG0030 [Ipomoea batatas]